MIAYGPFANVAPNSAKEVSVHYENNSPFLTVTEMTRVVEVSHWGNVAVEEDIDMRHTGAKLKGMGVRGEEDIDMRHTGAKLKGIGARGEGEEMADLTE